MTERTMDTANVTVPIRVSPATTSPLIIPMLYPCLSTRHNEQDQAATAAFSSHLPCSPAPSGTNVGRPVRLTLIPRVPGSSRTRPTGINCTTVQGTGAAVWLDEIVSTVYLWLSSSSRLAGGGRRS
jgi:hypothetical protein